MSPSIWIEAPLAPQPDRRIVQPRHAIGALFPALEDPTQLVRVAEGVGAVGRGHDGVASRARVLVSGEIGMDGAGDVAKELTHGVGGETRRGRGVRWRRCGAGRPAGLPSSGTPRTGGGVRENAELRLGNVEMELVELLVQRADLMTVFRCEQGEVGVEAPGFRGALGERRLPLGDTRPQCTEIVPWSGWYERRHGRIIAGCGDDRAVRATPPAYCPMIESGKHLGKRGSRSAAGAACQPLPRHRWMRSDA